MYDKKVIHSYKTLHCQSTDDKMYKNKWNLQNTIPLGGIIDAWLIRHKAVASMETAIIT